MDSEEPVGGSGVGLLGLCLAVLTGLLRGIVLLLARPASVSLAPRARWQPRRSGPRSRGPFTTGRRERHRRVSRSRSAPALPPTGYDRATGNPYGLAPALSGTWGAHDRVGRAVASMYDSPVVASCQCADCVRQPVIAWSAIASRALQVCNIILAYAGRTHPLGTKADVSRRTHGAT